MGRSPTPYAALNAVLDDFVGRAHEVLAESFIGAYLQGFFAIDGFDTYSDVDFLIVLDGDVADEQLPLLQALHENVYALASPWAQHLEGSYVPKQALQRFPPPQRLFWYLDNGAKHLVRSDHDDTLVVYWTLREKGIVLAGPRSRELVPPIPVDKLRDEIFTTMSTWRDHFAANPDNMNNRFYQPFVVLSYCRMLHSLTTGTIVSKPAALRGRQSIWIPAGRASFAMPATPDLEMLRSGCANRPIQVTWPEHGGSSNTPSA